ncbi:MAG TPA: putative glycolipid-binding domain-containing protein [Acidimicrobiia bacterium]|nr:putative glycolipid-binding domain-containing protein [Acidimicrobiia bacterium]
MAGVLWQPHDRPGAERAVIEPTIDGFRVAGTVLLVIDELPHEIRYSVLTDHRWRTRTVGAHVQGAATDRRLALHADGEGAWSVTDEPVVDLFGAIDADLSWTPATNTIAIRRLALEVGETAEVRVAHVAFPEHEVRRVTQHYTRVSDHRYVYRSPTAEVELTVDASGIVTHYPGGWTAVATG